MDIVRDATYLYVHNADIFPSAPSCDQVRMEKCNIHPVLLLTLHTVCPNCKSDNIDRTMFFFTGQYRCLDCGYEGTFVIEMDDYNYAKFLEEDQGP